MYVGEMCTFMFISREWIVIPLLLVLHFCVYTNHSNLWGKCVPDYVEAMEPYCTSSWGIHEWNCVDSTSAIIWTQKIGWAYQKVSWAGESNPALPPPCFKHDMRVYLSDILPESWKWTLKNVSKAGRSPALRSHVSSMTGGCTYPIYYRRVQVDNVENGTLLHHTSTKCDNLNTKKIGWAYPHGHVSSIIIRRQYTTR